MVLRILDDFDVEDLTFDFSCCSFELSSCACCSFELSSVKVTMKQVLAAVKKSSIVWFVGRQMDMTIKIHLS